MALGTLGSTLNDELNRLANGGTYRNMDQMVDEALAAKQWANRENINPYSTDTVGILNEIAGLGLDKRNWLDFNGVCNYIAGTTGLPAAAALRQVYPTTDLLTGVASYYVDATAPQNWSSLGYIYDNSGSTGLQSGITIPDATNLRITGDIDIRARVAFDDWTTGTIQEILGKWGGAGNRGWIFRLNASNQLEYIWSNDGTTLLTKVSTVTPTVSDGEALWVRVTLDVNNGASGNDVKFFTSTDGVAWTQLGSTVTTAGTTSIFATTANFFTSANANVASNKKIYNYQILNGIDGTPVLTIDVATNYKSTDFNTFFATTGQPVSVLGFAANANNLGTAGSLLPTTLGSSTAADSNDPKFLDFTGTNYVYLPGVSGNTLSVPDSAALDITGDLDIRTQVALDDWTPSAFQVLLSKYDADGRRSYRFFVNTNGTLGITWSTDGNAAGGIEKSSTVAPSIADGASIWVRATLDVDNGASGNDVKFYTSTDGTTWTQLGTTVTTAGTTSIFAGTASIFIGGNSNTSNLLAAKVFRAQIFDGIDGTKVLDVDTSVITAGSQTSFTAVTGQTVTINRATSGRKTVAVTQPTWLFGTDDYMEVNNRYMSSGTYLYLPGVNSNDCSTPDAAALDITGDIDLRVKVALDDWTPSTANTLIAKYSSAGQRSYGLLVQSTGVLRLQWSADGTAALTADSTVAPTIADGQTLWVRATLDVDDGAGNRVITFYTSTDGTTWTQLGNTVTTVGTTSIFNSSAGLVIGTIASGSPARGKFFRAQVLNGIDGTVAFDANFETSITSLEQASFTESSANSATVTINRSGSAYRSAGITAAGYLYPGATNTFAASATDFLNFGASDSFTMLAVARRWNTQAYQIVFYKKLNDNNANAGYGIFADTTDRAGIAISDGVNGQALFSGSSYPTGTLTSIFAEREVATDRLILTTGTTITGTDITTGSLSSLISTLTVGRQSTGTYADMEFYAGAVFRIALSTAQIRQIANYFRNREVYL